VAGPRRWLADLANGRWDTILADADRDGIDATLEGAGSEDLLALADAARYRRRIDLARAALLAHRRRFPGSARSLDAIFLLGRVEELRDQSAAAAIAWYDAYLTQAPAGTYAAEALGRKMILIGDSRGRAAARPIADAYLLRFPNGSYAGSARALQRAP
jgi:TolA-binding protein